MPINLINRSNNRNLGLVLCFLHENFPVINFYCVLQGHVLLLIFGWEIY